MLRKNAEQTSQKLSQLPILRNSERALNELRPRASTSLNHVLRVVERDPALAFELFTNVNRHLKQLGKPPATNIRRAILVFGLARYLDHCKSFRTIEQDLSPSLLRPLFHHLGRSYLSACLSQTLARARGGLNPEDAFSFGLARDLDSYAGQLIGAANLTLDVGNATTLLPGLTNPTTIGDPLHWCAETAFKFSSACESAWDESVLSPLFEMVAGNFSAEPTDIRAMLVNTIISAGRETQHFNDFPAARFMMNPGPQLPIAALKFPPARKDRVGENAHKPTRSNKLASTGQSEQGALRKEKTPEQTPRQIPEQTPRQTPRQTPTQAQYLLDTKQLERAGLQVSKAIENLAVIGSTVTTRTRAIPFALNVMVNVLKASKALFIAHPADNQLVARIQVGKDKKPVAVKLPLNPENNPLLQQALTSPKPRHITAKQLQQHTNLFEPKLITFLGANEAYCIPLVGKKNIIGIMLLRFDQQTTEDWTTHFKLSNEVATHLVQALSASIN